MNRIPLRNDAIKIKSSKIISIPYFKNLIVYGLEQFINIPNFEVANANLIRKSSGFYIKVTVFIPKSNFNRKETNKSVGLDFGIKTAITTSDGEKFDCNKQETDKLKFLQKQLHKKVKKGQNVITNFLIKFGRSMNIYRIRKKMLQIKLLLIF